MTRISALLIWLALFPVLAKAQTIVENGTSKTVSIGKSGKLHYSEDKKGNRLPDFSYVGYHSGEKALPEVPVKITLKPVDGDNTLRIQKALDEIGKLSTDENGHRGALLLEKGFYRVEGSLVIKNSGVVLRGEGNSNEGTVIAAAGYNDYKYKRTLITVGNNDDIVIDEYSKQEIIDVFVQVGTHTFKVKSSCNFKAGDRIVVYRPSIKEWIKKIGCDKLEPRWAGIRDVKWIQNKDTKKEQLSYVTGANAGQAKQKGMPGFYYQRLGYDQLYFIPQREGETWDEFKGCIPISEDEEQFNFTRQWQPGEYDFYFERRIVAINGNEITIDAPIVHTMQREFGGGAIYRYKTEGRISEVGIENLRLVSEFAEPEEGNLYGNTVQQTKAEKHAWNAIELNNNTENTWVRDVTGNYFGWSLVSVRGKKATIQDCVNLGHASEIAGGRRYPFMVNGQLNLVQRCIAFEGRHEFVNQQKTLGPNVFVDCIGFESKSNAGPHHRYAVGNLYDNISSKRPMESRFRGNSGTGHGWAAAQTCFYNCTAPDFLVENPAGEMCWVLGSGKPTEKNIRLQPGSLYYQQVKERLGNETLKHLTIPGQLEKLGEYPWVENRLKNEKNTNGKKQ
jgi:hypothetical protein